MLKSFILVLLLLPFINKAQSSFHENFLEKSFRFDFVLGGNATEMRVYPQQMKQESYWAGSLNNLIDTFHYGTYRFRVLDLKTEDILFSKGFNTLFQEWQTTPEAKQINKTFYQSVIFPFPKKKVKLEIDARKRDGHFETVFQSVIEPENYFILKEKPLPFETIIIEENGPPEESVDIVILAEGYKTEEMDKFIDDAHRVTNYLFNAEPFKTERKKFNVRAVLTPSIESGTDIPGEGIYKNTYFNAAFYTFDMPRYLTTSDMKSIYDAAALVPYDQIYLLVNTDRYGGGGFYNFLSICSSDHLLTPEVFVHEFGHGFAGLADEYYSSSVAYEDFYNLKTEPWEPNITTLIDFDEKWSGMIADSVPVPTPRTSKYRNVTGVFEGGGYMEKGIYSPSMDCRMKSNNVNYFCPVCVDAIRRKIDFLTQ
jgi:hypothetical protein